MNENPYESPQSVPDKATSWTQSNIIATIRASLAELGLGFAVICLLVFPIITFIPGSEKGVYKIPALLGCVGLLHPYRLPFILGGISLLALGILTLFSN